MHIPSRFTATWMLAVSLLAWTTGCARSQSPMRASSGSRETLKQRAEAWTDSMTSLSGQKTKDVEVISAFLEPCAFTEKTASQWHTAIKDYYDDWETAAPGSVFVDEGGDMGTVAYKQVHKCPGGGEEILTVVTNWLRLNGVWYRSIEDFGWEKGTSARASY